MSAPKMHADEVDTNAALVGRLIAAQFPAWTLSQALIFIPYYLHTNPTGVAIARRTIDAVLTGGARGD